MTAIQQKNNQLLMITLCEGGNGMKKLIIKKQFCSFFLSYTRNIKIVIWILYLNIFELKVYEIASNA